VFTGPNGIEGTIKVTFDGTTFIVDGAIKAANGTTINEFSIDGGLSGNSDDALPTEKAVKTYVDAEIIARTFDEILTTDDDAGGNNITNLSTIEVATISPKGAAVVVAITGTEVLSISNGSSASQWEMALNQQADSSSIIMFQRYEIKAAADAGNQPISAELFQTTGINSVDNRTILKRWSNVGVTGAMVLFRDLKLGINEIVSDDGTAAVAFPKGIHTSKRNTGVMNNSDTFVLVAGVSPSEAWDVFVTRADGGTAGTWISGMFSYLGGSIVMLTGGSNNLTATLISGDFVLTNVSAGTHDFIYSIIRRA